MCKSKCKWCVEGAYLDPHTLKVVCRCFCDIDSYDPDVGCNRNCTDYERDSKAQEACK